MPKKYKRKDHYYQKAKEENFRSRAYFKLEELDKKYKLFRKNSKVLDLGAWPGSWIEYLEKKTDNTIVGIDLAEIDPFTAENIYIIKGDIQEEESLSKIKEISPLFNSVISDLSPKLTGIKEADQMAVSNLLETAFQIASKCLKPKGNFIAKAFKSNEVEECIRNNKKLFRNIYKTELKSSRTSSGEFYIIGLGFTGNAN